MHHLTKTIQIYLQEAGHGKLYKNVLWTGPTNNVAGLQTDTRKLGVFIIPEDDQLLVPRGTKPSKYWNKTPKPVTYSGTGLPWPIPECNSCSPVFFKMLNFFSFFFLKKKLLPKIHFQKVWRTMEFFGIFGEYFGGWYNF